MTVYGLEYRPKDYRPTSAWQRLRPLVRAERNVLFRSKWGIGTLLFCVSPLFVRLVILLGYLGLLPFAGRLRDAAEDVPPAMRMWIPTEVEFYVEQVVAMEQGFFVFLVLTAMATARTIAKDRATNALELYWTRGISPFGYFVGKWFGAFSLVGCVTVGGGLLLWLVGILFAEDWTYFESTAPFMPRALFALLTFTVVMTLLCVLLSAVCASANLATILWCLLLGGSFAVEIVLRELLPGNRDTTAAIWEAAATVARAIAGVPYRGHSLEGSLWLLGALLLSLSLLARRSLRATEAIQ